MDIGPGDWVICIDAGPCRFSGKPCNLEPDGVYCIEAVWPPEASLNNVPGVDILGVDHPVEGWMWALNRFLPLKKPRKEPVKGVEMLSEGLK